MVVATERFRRAHAIAEVTARWRMPCNDTTFKLPQTIFREKDEIVFGPKSEAHKL
jgi:hypothetical protein